MAKLYFNKIIFICFLRVIFSDIVCMRMRGGLHVNYSGFELESNCQRINSVAKKNLRFRCVVITVDDDRVCVNVHVRFTVRVVRYHINYFFWNIYVFLY